MLAMIKRVVPLCSVLVWCSRKERKDALEKAEQSVRGKKIECPDRVTRDLRKGYHADLNQFLYIAPKSYIFDSLTVECHEDFSFKQDREIAGSTLASSDSIVSSLGLSGESAVHGVHGGLNAGLGRDSGSEEELFIDTDESGQAKFEVSASNRQPNDYLRNAYFSDTFFSLRGEFYIGGTSKYGQGMRLMYYSKSSAATSNVKTDLGLEGGGSKAGLEGSGTAKLGTEKKDSETNEYVNMKMRAVGGSDTYRFRMNDILVNKWEYNQTLNSWINSLEADNSELIEVKVTNLCHEVSSSKRQNCEDKLSAWWVQNEVIPCYFSWWNKRRAYGSSCSWGRCDCSPWNKFWGDVAKQAASRRDGITCYDKKAWPSGGWKAHHWQCEFKIKRGLDAGSSCEKKVLGTKPIGCCGAGHGKPPDHSKTDYNLWGNLQNQKNLMKVPCD